MKTAHSIPFYELGMFSTIQVVILFERINLVFNTQEAVLKYPRAKSSPLTFRFTSASPTFLPSLTRS